MEGLSINYTQTNYHCFRMCRTIEKQNIICCWRVHCMSSEVIEISFRQYNHNSLSISVNKSSVCCKT